MESIVATRETLALFFGNRRIRNLHGDFLRFLQRLMERVERMTSRFENGDARVDLRTLFKVADRRRSDELDLPAFRFFATSENIQ